MSHVEPEAFYLVAESCVRECIRQEAGLLHVGYLIEAYAWALDRSSRPPSEVDARQLQIIVLGSARAQSDSDGYRQTALAHPQDAVDWREVPGAMARLFAHVASGVDAKEFVRALLRIHPWADGNGRTAFLLYNWLSGDMHAPLALPNLFGETATP